MISFMLWYLVITLAGAVAFPLAFRFLPALPDRGYTLARAFGLLLWGYLFWLLTSLGFLQNNAGGIVTGLVLVLALSLWVGWKDRFREMIGWLRDHQGMILTSEVLFLILFAIMAFIRSASPEISGTEKPMELAFINAILHSPTFPPHDPWLSGYAISYYYFGYVMVAMLCQMTGVVSGVGFNLALASWFALIGIGAYGVIYNLLANQKIKKGLLAAPILGPVFILIVSNYEGILDVLHSLGVFWQRAADGTLQSGFWRLLDITELKQAPQNLTVLPNWFPTRPGGIIWWQASRVVSDYTLDGNWKEVIDEFPFFSFLLGDLHPHVLAMPFALLVIGLALNLFLSKEKSQFRILGLTIPIGIPTFLLSSVVLGGLAFLNTWDFPIYVALVSGAFVLAAYIRDGWKKQLIGEFLKLGISLGLTGILLYLPFYLGFSSQSRFPFVLPSMVFFTRGIQFWVMFGPLLIPILAFLIYLNRKQKTSFRNFLKMVLLVVAGLAILFLLSSLFALAASLSPTLNSMFLQNLGAFEVGMGGLLWQSLIRRLASPGTWLTLGALIVLIIALLNRKKPTEEMQAMVDEVPSRLSVPGQKHAFLLLLVFFGVLLTLIPEFFYLLDQFGWRINTIFKFYFQAWILWALAAAYASALLLRVSLKGRRFIIFWPAWVLVIAISLAYPIFGLANRTNSFKPGAGYTLDGNAYLERYNSDEMAAIRWLEKAPPGVVAEAIGGSYTSFARVSTHSGQPTVLGWPGHESQWRGGATEMGSRSSDIETLYRTGDWTAAEVIIDQYKIRYIFMGELERSTYRANEAKFQQFLRPAFQQGSVVVYENPIFNTTQTDPVRIIKP